MKRLFVAGLLFVFMAVMPLFHAVADNTCDGRIENYVSATGTVAQNGTPTPDNPIEPTFYQQGDMVLRKVGNYADSYDATTGKITRRVGVKVLDGTENWQRGAESPTFKVFLEFFDSPGKDYQIVSCSHFAFLSAHITSAVGDNQISMFKPAGASTYDKIVIGKFDISGVMAFKQWLADQYNAGTPVTVYYPLAEPVEENWPSSYCAPDIKIATTAYNAARFNPVKTDLDSAVATIREIVTKTINQTAAIASLQADKQTRPEDACPAGKKCLLVETEENGVIVPHWFPIIEAPEE